MTYQEVLIVKKERIRWENRLQAREKALIGSGIANRDQMTLDNHTIEKEVIKQMNLKQKAELTSMGNVTDLDSIPTDVEIYTENGTNKDGRVYSFDYIELNGKKYRIPMSVIKMIGKLPDAKNVKVTSTGTDMDTRYKVVAL